jgi:hypothetical protein
MEHQSSNLELLDSISGLQFLLKSDISIGEAIADEVIATVKITNTAPDNLNGSDIVFTGVGLRLTSLYSERVNKGSNYWPSRTTKKPPSSSSLSRQKYLEGTYIGGNNQAFPAVTGDEQSHGDTLFPGERTEYQVKLKIKDLPYLDIQVEGSLSRRHLFHFYQKSDACKPWSQPLLIETINQLNVIDFFSSLTSLPSKFPDFGPNTTIAEIQNCSKVIADTEEAVKKALNATKNIKPPSKILLAWLVETQKYLNSLFPLFNVLRDLLSGNDLDKIKTKFNEIMIVIGEVEILKSRWAKLKSDFEFKG